MDEKKEKQTELCCDRTSVSLTEKIILLFVSFLLS